MNSHGFPLNACGNEIAPNDDIHSERRRIGPIKIRRKKPKIKTGDGVAHET
jgi:hypothetical protein